MAPQQYVASRTAPLPRCCLAPQGVVGGRAVCCWCSLTPPCQKWNLCTHLGRRRRFRRRR
eukprot:1135214-Pleurochrysis_carterae.AAC.2